MAAKRGRFTHEEKDYWDPILLSIQELELTSSIQYNLEGEVEPWKGAHIDRILRGVENRMDLLEADREYTKGGWDRIWVSMIRNSLYRALPNVGLVEAVGDGYFRLTAEGRNRAERAMNH